LHRELVMGPGPQLEFPLVAFSASPAADELCGMLLRSPTSRFGRRTVVSACRRGQGNRDESEEQGMLYPIPPDAELRFQRPGDEHLFDPGLSVKAGEHSEQARSHLGRDRAMPMPGQWAPGCRRVAEDDCCLHSLVPVSSHIGSGPV
jgi:hypothetical protein